MRRRPGGFLLVELVTAITIFCAVLLVLLFAISRAGELAAVNLERTQAAALVSQVLDETCRGLLEVREGEGVPLLPGEPRLTEERCTVKVEPWADLRKVTVTVAWQSAVGGRRSVSATTLVRTKRLKLTEAGP